VLRRIIRGHVYEYDNALVFVMTHRDRALLDSLAAYWGVTRAQALRTLIRRMAQTLEIDKDVKDFM
jgi:hypothetical protein